jgi:hypothetical protein
MIVCNNKFKRNYKIVAVGLEKTTKDQRQIPSGSEKSCSKPTIQTVREHFLLLSFISK